MLKRTQSRLLLGLLVITGLAGTLNNTSLSQKERKYAMNLMKDGKTELFNSVEGLSKAQLDYKPNQDSRSIREYIFHIASCEKNCWNLLSAIMKTAPDPDKRSLINYTDDELVSMIEDPEHVNLLSESLKSKNKDFTSLEDALGSFRLQRTNHIKYVKLSTEDLRNHVVQMPFGWIDCYQFCLMISAHSQRHIKQIQELKADPGFPEK